MEESYKRKEDGRLLERFRNRDKRRRQLRRKLHGVAELLLAAVLLISTGVGLLPASAQGEEARSYFYYSNAADLGVVEELDPSYDLEHVIYTMIDGKIGYCLNYLKKARSGTQLYAGDRPVTELTAEQESLLKYALYYGYGTENMEEPDERAKTEDMITQGVIWCIVADIFGTESGDHVMDRFCQATYEPDHATAYNRELQDHILQDSRREVPSFAARDAAAAPSYELKWTEEQQRYEAVLEDSTGKLGEFQIESSAFNCEVQDANHLLIYTEQAQPTAQLLTMRSAAGHVLITGNCIFWQAEQENYQEFISGKPDAEAAPSYIQAYTETLGSCQIEKQDTGSGLPVAGAVYGIYADQECSRPVASMTTDARGHAQVDRMHPGIYFIKETEAPKGYYCSQQVYQTEVRPGCMAGIQAADQEILAGMIIQKEGECLTGWDGKEFRYSSGAIRGAVYRLLAGADIYAADGSLLYREDECVADDLITDEKGETKITGLHPGLYVVEEKKAPAGYLRNEIPQVVQLLEPDQSAQTAGTEGMQVVKQTDKRQKLQVTGCKKDAESGKGLAGAELGLYAAKDILAGNGKILVKKGELLEKGVTGTDGKIVFKLNLPPASYYVQELQAPEGYVCSTERQQTVQTNTEGKKEEQEILFYQAVVADQRIPKKPEVERDTDHVPVPGVPVKAVPEQEVVMEQQEVQQTQISTGDRTPVYIYGGLSCAAILAILLLGIWTGKSRRRE